MAAAPDDGVPSAAEDDDTAAVTTALAGASLASPAMLANDTVALLVISRAPRADHAAVAATCRRFARLVLSTEGAATLRKERVASGWLDAPPAPHYSAFPDLGDLFDLRDTCGPMYLLKEKRGRACFLLLCHLISRRRGAAPDVRTAIADFCIDVVSAFYSNDLVRVMMQLDCAVPHDASSPTPDDGGWYCLIEAKQGLGADFPEHVERADLIIDMCIAAWPQFGWDEKYKIPDFITWYSQKLVDLGLLREYYDERTQTHSIDADGWALRDLRAVWKMLNNDRNFGTCPMDASVVIVFCYIIVMSDDDTMKRLFATEAQVMTGGIMDRMFVTQGGGGIGNMLEAATHIIEHDLAHAREMGMNDCAWSSGLLLDPAARREYKGTPSWPGPDATSEG